GAVQFSPDDHWLVASGFTQAGSAAEGSPPTEVLWDLQHTDYAANPIRLPSFTDQPGFSGSQRVAFSPDGRWLAAWRIAQVWLWDLRLPDFAQRHRRLDLLRDAPPSGLFGSRSGLVTISSLSADSTLLASGFANGSTRFWDLSGEAPVPCPIELTDEDVQGV